MEVSGFLSAIVVGLVIGALARLVTPGREPIGCLLTILIGLVGAIAGAAVGARVGTGLWGTVIFQVVIAAVLVALFQAVSRSRR